MNNIDDKGLLAGTIHLIKNGTFELKGSEVQLVARMIEWLDKDVRQMIHKSNKPKDQPIKKTGAK